MNVLVTGGAGYIGSHAVQRLLRDAHAVVALDSLVRGHREAIARLEPSAGGRLSFVHADVGDAPTVARVLREHRIDAVMHFAALTSVGESVAQPLTYHRNNTAAALSLLECCAQAGVPRFVFSSTAAVYGEPGPDRIPIREDCPPEPINPYGRSKLAFERILADHARACAAAGTSFAFAALRYFNVAGCDSTGLLGEDHDPETHLIPVVLQAALGRRDAVTIFGTDYPTPDGTCVRDYVHVEDLADAHATVLDALRPGDARTYNLGIGRGCSVREIIETARRVTGEAFAVREGPRRAGDPAVLFADPGAIRRDLGWRAQRTDLHAMIDSAWRWFRAHPRGYAGG